MLKMIQIFFSVAEFSLSIREVKKKSSQQKKSDKAGTIHTKHCCIHLITVKMMMSDDVLYSLDLKTGLSEK